MAYLMSSLSGLSKLMAKGGKMQAASRMGLAGRRRPQIIRTSGEEEMSHLCLQCLRMWKAELSTFCPLSGLLAGCSPQLHYLIGG